MKDYLRYAILSDEEQRDIDYASNKKDAIKRAKELEPKYGKMTIYKTSNGDIEYETKGRR